MKKLALLIALVAASANAQTACHHTSGTNYAYCDNGTTIQFNGSNTTVADPDGSTTTWHHNTTSWGNGNYSTNSYSDRGDYSQSTTNNYGNGNSTTTRTITHADGSTTSCHTTTINGYSQSTCQ